MMNKQDACQALSPQAEPSLLIVDDAQMMRLKIQVIAEAAGWKRITQAPNGEKAIELHQQNRFDLITMDLVMPGIDGLTTLQSIRSFDPKANVVMVSAVNQKEKLLGCISAGAMDFIVKPFDPARLQHFLEDRYQLACDAIRRLASQNATGGGSG
jgi:two-component system, chemotaxis family, chemotaxis protein CheY